MSTITDLHSAIVSLNSEVNKAVAKITDLEAKLAAAAPVDLTTEVSDVNAATAALAAVDAPSEPAP